MLTIAALRQKKIDAQAEMKATRSEFNALIAGGDLNAEQVKTKDALKAKRDAIEARIADLDEAIKNAEEQAREDAASGTAVLDGPAKLAAEQDPKKGFKSHKDLLLAVIDSGRGIRQDKRLALIKAPMLATVGSDEHSIASDPNGGFLVPEAFAPGVLTRSVEADPFAGATPVPMQVPTINLTARVDANHTSSVSGGLTVTRRPETTSVGTPSRMAFEKIQLNATPLFGYSAASRELLEYSPSSFVALLQAGFRDEFLVKGVDERINGSGVGEPEGILTNPATISITKEVGQAAATITYNNILAMRARCWGYGNAVWIANHDCLPTLAKMSFVVGTGGSAVFVPNTNPATLLGRPLYFSEYPKTVGTVGDIILVNTTQYLDGTLQGLQDESSIHVRFENHESVFKFWVMNDGKCWWRAALTPKNSTATMSPFVTLATRA